MPLHFPKIEQLQLIQGRDSIVFFNYSSSNKFKIVILINKHQFKIIKVRLSIKPSSSFSDGFI
jgi:hypothetical protein